MGRTANPLPATVTPLAQREELLPTAPEFLAEEDFRNAMVDCLQGGQMLGVFDSASAFHTITGMAQLRAYEWLREGARWKRVPIQSEDGTLFYAPTIEQFCALRLGVSYKKLEDECISRAKLGTPLYEAAQRIGLRRDDRRMLALLSPNERTVVEDAIAGGADGRKVAAMISDLREQVADKEAASDKLKADLQTTKDDLTRAEKDLREARRLRADPDAIARKKFEELAHLANKVIFAVRDYASYAEELLGGESPMHVQNEAQSHTSRIALAVQAAFADLQVEFDPTSVAPPQGFTES